MNKEELIKEWGKFAESNGFMLNPDKNMVEVIAEGILMNEKKHGLKLCPCRLRDGTKERDLELLCPCDFTTHQIWKEKDMCHCSLFIKRKEE